MPIAGARKGPIQGVKGSKPPILKNQKGEPRRRLPKLPATPDALDLLELSSQNPSGQLIYDADGHFSQIIIRSDLPKSHPTIAWRELQRKTRLSCRGVLPSSAATR
jgi:hypothetical protein